MSICKRYQDECLYFYEIFIMEYSKGNESHKFRLCQLSNVKRNYRKLLIDKHPEADPINLSVYG